MPDLRILAWNVRGITSAVKRAALIDALGAYDIAVLTETWLDPEQARSLHFPGFRHYFCCRPRPAAAAGRRAPAGRHSAGVSVLVRFALQPFITVLPPPAGSVLDCVWLRVSRRCLQSHAADLVCCAAYIPPAGTNFYSQTGITAVRAFELLGKHVADTVRDGESFVLLGDLNAHTGTLSDVPNLPDGHWQRGPATAVPLYQAYEHVGERCNEDPIAPCAMGAALIQSVCIPHGLVIANGRACGDEAGAVTHQAVHSHRPATLDYCIVSLALLSRISTLRVLPFTTGGPKFSDHAPLDVRLAVLAERAHAPAPPPRAPRFDVSRWPLYAAEVCSAECASEIDRIHAALRDGTATVTDTVTALARTLRAASKRAFAHTPTDPGTTGLADWWTQECADAKQPYLQALAALHDARAAAEAPRDVPALRERMRELRRIYCDVCKRAREAAGVRDLGETLERLLKEDPRQFWRGITPDAHSLPSRAGAEALSMDAAYAGFRQLLSSKPVFDERQTRIARDEVYYLHTMSGAAARVRGQPPNPDQLTAQTLAKKAERTAAAVRHGMGDAFELSASEVEHALLHMRNGKAAGADRMPAEHLKYARRTLTLPDGSQRTESVLTGLCTTLFNQIICSRQYPEPWCTTLLTPIYKGKGAKSDPNNYRGVAVACALAKCYASAVERRVSAFLEAEGLRAFGQAGFRRKVGTHHNLFVLRHLIDVHCFDPGNLVLIACFVDFTKAFDTVQREVLWQRARTIGLHGQMLDALRVMYHTVSMRVKLNGKLSAVFDSVIGVKQGDPLSPALFGIFIEVLPELLAEYMASGELRLDLHKHSPFTDGMILIYMLFADDLTLMARSREAIQVLLDKLSHFSAVMGLEVNVSKTECVVFGHPRALRKFTDWPSRFRPKPFAPTYNGQPIRVVTEARYVGMRFRNDGSPTGNEEALRLAGTRASFALRARMLALGNLTPAMQTDLFDRLVRPVITYGCQVWGDEHLVAPDPDEPPTGKHAFTRSGPLEKVVTDFARFVTRAGKLAPNACLLRDLCLDTVQITCAQTVLRFWNELRDKPDCMAGRVARADARALHWGNTRSWTYHVCIFLADLGLIPHPRVVEGLRLLREYEASRPAARLYFSSGMAQEVFPPDLVDYLMSLRIDVNDAVARLRKRWDARLARATASPPRTCALHPKFNAYVNWASAPSAADSSQRPAHLTAHIPTEKRAWLFRFRLGTWVHLAVNAARLAPPPHLPRHLRVCTRCTAGCVEDELHIALECRCYQHIRDRFPLLFPPPPRAPAAAGGPPSPPSTPPNPDCRLRSLLNHPQQGQVADFIYELYKATKPHEAAH
jgi:exonuclease III